ncbi:Putative surface-exposed virulence protein BigA, partial [Frankliniella fusca]
MGISTAANRDLRLVIALHGKSEVWDSQDMPLQHRHQAQLWRRQRASQPTGRSVRPAPSRAPPAFRGHDILTPQPGHGLSRKDPRTPVPSCSSDSDDSPPRRAPSPDGAGSPPRRPPPSSGEDSPPADEGGASPPRMRS